MNPQPKTSNLSSNTWGGGLLRIAISVFTIVLIALGWFVATTAPYKAGSSFGHNMGWVGGGLMFFMLAYSLRKRFPFLNRLGQLRYWFQMHMVFGIAGPLLALFHSTFKAGAMNSRIALYSMLLVAGSGIVGRYVYRHIHHGLYGRKATLAEVEQQMKESAESMSTVFGLVPAIGEKLAGFQSFALRKLDGAWAHTWHFLILRQRGRGIARATRHDAWHALDRMGHEQNWSHSELLTHRRLAKEQIDDYVEAVCSTATFVTWERLFALWHVVHVPFIYLFFFSVVVHVIAHYMY
ncbi:MAG: hypothetical protein ACD_23C00288G0002 [uncultured bacterium]|nr:MAG: hypothetical protein ACD_23C00288G0002 [uncultured bacterium]